MSGNARERLDDVIQYYNVETSYDHFKIQQFTVGEFSHPSRNTLALFMSCILDIDGVNIMKLSKSKQPNLHKDFVFENKTEEESNEGRKKVKLYYNQTALEIVDDLLKKAGYGEVTEEGVYTNEIENSVLHLDKQSVTDILSRK